jgi:hypothetical protein
VEGELGINLVLLDDPHDFVQEGSVFEHEQVGIEDATFLRAHALAHFSLHLQDFAAGLDERFFEAVDFLRQVRVGKLPLGDGRADAPQDDDPATTNTAGNRDAPEFFFSFMVGRRHGIDLAQEWRLGKGESWGEKTCQAAVSFHSLNDEPLRRLPR